MRIACHRCSTPTDDPTGLCPKCRQSYRSPTERPYDEVEWKRRSKAFLRTHRWCVLCLADGLSTVATVADHWPVSRRELVASAVNDPDANHRLRPLCVSHHNARASSHTMRFDNDPA